MKHPLLEVGKIFGHFRGRVVWASVCSVINKIFDILPEVLIGVAIDIVVRGEESFLGRLGIIDPFRQIVVLGLITFFVWVFESLFEYLYKVAWQGLAQDVQHELRLKAFDHVQRLDLAFYEDQSTGTLVATLNDDINQLERFLNFGASQVIQLLTTVIGVGTVFFLLSPTLSFFAFLPIPVIMVGALQFRKHIEPKYQVVRERASDLARFITNALSGIVVIKSFSAQSRILDALRKESSNYSEANKAAIRVSSAYVPVIRMAILGGFLCTLIYGGKMTLDATLPVGSYGVLVFLTQRLLWPFTALGELVDLYERAMASTRRILNLLSIQRGIESAERTLIPSKSLPRGEIEFRNVSFKYAQGGWVFRNLSFKIPAHTSAAFVGPTGSGKSTLVKLILRLYDPLEGEILLDGRPLRDYHPLELRNWIGLVSQDVFLFHGTVFENIAFGQESERANVPPSLQKIEEAARVAEAHGFIQKLSAKYDTLIGERGQKLSGGQKQRLSIARAVLKNPPILVLDEATSAVDNETEAAIQVSLETIKRNRTVVLVAHRLSTIIGCDQVLVMENGQIVQSGRHRELIEAAGTYQKLWQVQTGLRV